MINFSNSVTKPMLELGKKDGANAIAMGEGVSFELFEKYMSLSEVEKEKVSLNEYFSTFYTSALK